MADAEERNERTERRASQQEGRRVRSILKSYYGVADGDASGPADPTNIDSASFDSDKFFDGLLKTSSLSELVHKDSEMVSDIKSLDGDMKTLVYENYNKFISATDTIRKMKSNVENMEAEMVHLSKNMDKITECSERINSTLAVRRDKIEQLGGVNRLLQKLQFLVALPARLAQCIEMSSYTQAVKYYTITGGILDQYKHLPSFHAIHVECNRIIDDLRVKLREKIKSPETPPPEVSEAADLLIELNEPIDILRTLYLDGRRVSIDRLLKGYADQDPPQLSGFIPDFSQQFLAALLYTQQSYRSLFINRYDTSTLTAAGKEQSSKLLDDFSKDVFSRFLTVVKAKLGGSHSTEEKILGLEALHGAILRVNAQLTDLSAVDKVADVVNTTVHAQIGAYFTKLQTSVAGHIQALCEALADSKTQSATTPPPQTTTTTTTTTDATLTFSELSERACKAIVSEIHALFDSVRPFMSSESKFLTTHFGVIFTKIQVKMQQFFLFLNIHMLEYIDASEDKNPKQGKVSARFVLQLVGVALYVETRGLQQVLQLDAELGTLAQKKGGGGSGSVDISAFNAPDLAKRIRETSQKLLTHYVKLQGAKISSMLRKGIEATPDWLKKKEPRDVRPVIEMVLDQEIIKTAQEVNVVFSSPTASAATAGGVGSGSSASSPSPAQSAAAASQQQQRGNRLSSSATYQPVGGSSSGGSSGGVDVRRNASMGTLAGTLFDKKVNIFANVEFNANSVIIGIVNIGLKSMYECVRLRTFGRNGYQQIQVDLQFMRLVLWGIIRKGTPVDTLLDEVEHSVAERCVDPVPMEPSIINKLCEAKLAQRNTAQTPPTTH